VPLQLLDCSSINYGGSQSGTKQFSKHGSRSSKRPGSRRQLASHPGSGPPAPVLPAARAPASLELLAIALGYRGNRTPQESAPLGILHSFDLAFLLSDVTVILNLCFDCCQQAAHRLFAQYLSNPTADLSNRRLGR